MRVEKTTAPPTLDPATGTGAALLEIITTGAEAIITTAHKKARAELTTADELGSQASIYADRAAEKIRALIEHAPPGHTRKALKEIQALTLAAGVNALMTVYRMRDAADLLSTTGKPE